MKIEKYYMVHNVNYGKPMKQHFNKEVAVEEAKRIAKSNIGHKVFVLEAVACFSVIQPEPEELILIDYVPKQEEMLKT